MKLLIVGGVAGGASAAARARRLSESAQIIMFERGPDVSFANCGMPYFIGGEIEDRNKLLVVTPERLQQRYRIHTRTHAAVESIDRRSRTVVVRELHSGKTYIESYDKLILATGASPLRPPLEGLDLPGIYTLRHLDDMDCIRAATDKCCQEVLVVGAGFIGLELVENFVRRGIRATILDHNGQVLPPLDREMTTPICKELEQQGITVLLGETVQGFEQADGRLRVQLKSGKVVNVDVVVLGVGIRPENQLAVQAGLDIGPRGGIRVNAQMQTSDPNIYAVGDVVETTDVLFGGPTQIPLAGPANRQGRLAADHIFGRDVAYRGTQGTAILRVFRLTAACTGWSEKQLKAQGKEYRKVYIHPAQHASYYPGATPMTLKLLCDPASGCVLGAQGVGGEGVDKRIDVLAMAIQGGLTVFDLEQAELAYSPQYGSAKDPINMLGFVAAELLRGEHQQITVEELLAAAPRPCLVDVRTEAEYTAGHIPDALHLPVDELRDRLSDLPTDTPLVTYCQVGQRGYLAQRILRQRGYEVRNLSGGFKTYELMEAPVAR